MKRGLSNVLSLVIGSRSIVLAHVTTGKPNTVAKRVGQFLLDDANWLDKADASGKALRAFLDSHGFDATHAIIGVPAGWLLAQEKEVPPTDANSASAILRLAAERLAMSGSAPLVADYAGKPSTSVDSKVLLVGMLRSQYEKLEKFASAAGLTISAVCPTSLGVLDTLAGDSSLLRITNDGAEIVTQDAGVPTMIRPIAAAPQQLAAELKRTLAMRPGGVGRLAIADGGTLAGGDRDNLLARVGGSPRVLDEASCPGIGFDTAAMNGAATGLTKAAALPAVALGAAAIAAKLPVDFADSKLAEVAPQRFGRKTIWAVALVALAIIGVIALEWTVESREAEAADIAKKVAEISPQLKTAKASVAKLDFGRPYFAPHPPQLDCLKAITNAFNYNELIFADNVQLRDTGSGTLAGKAVNGTLPLALLDRMKAQPQLSNVQLSSLQNNTGKEKESAFSITFTFIPAPFNTAPPTTKPSITAAAK